MKNYLLLILAVLTIATFSCKEEECEKNKTGELRMINAIAVEMTVSIDGGPEFTLQPGEEQVETVAEGVHDVDVTRDVQGILTTTSFGKDITACVEGNIKVEF